jgi:hypothetical protein
MARGAVVDFDAFMAGCKMKYQQLAEISADKGAEAEELLSAAQGCALLVLLGGGAPNSRPGQLYPLAVSSAGAPPCLAPRCNRRGCLGNTLTLGGGAARLVFFHHKCFESWRLEPAVIELQVRAACGAAEAPARPAQLRARRAGWHRRGAGAGHRGARGAADRARQGLGSPVHGGGGGADGVQHLSGTHRLPPARGAPAGRRGDGHIPAARDGGLLHEWGLQR